MALFDRLFGRRDGGDGELREPDLSFARSEQDLGTKTAFHDSTWALGSSSWDADLQAGTISFRNDRDWVITAPVQVVGTLNTADGSWLWGWDHPSVRPELGEDAGKVRDFGERYGLEQLTTRHIAATEADAWRFAALACYLAGAQGAYRGPAGPTLVFMTFGTVSISKPQEQA